VSGATDVRAVVVGDGHACFIQGPSRAVYCFGNNSARQLGDGSIVSTRTPVAARGLGGAAMTGAVDVAAGRMHNCAAFDSGAVLCWGYSYAGETGSAAINAATDANPVPIGDAVGVAAGDAYSCAVKASGQVACWGRSDIAQFGVAGSGLNPSPLTTVSPTLSNVAAIAAGWNLACARERDGRVRCWGTGMFGNGQVNETRLTPTLVGGLTGVGTIAAGGFHQCALRDNATLACWGSNTNGQLATGDTIPRTTPTDVVVSGGFAAP
jgi:alpha-tubulin suppressor-like RCC1 family protein